MNATRAFKWYAVSAMSGREAKAERDLKRKIAAEGASDAVREILVPRETIIEHDAKGKRKEKAKVVMPGYILINMVAADASRAVLSTPGIYGFVTGGDDPVPLSEEEVARFVKHGATSPRHVDAVAYEKGELVRIVAGPMADFTGIVDEINSEKSTLRLLVEIFGQSTPTEVAMDAVRKDH